jgi:hypothetical protein
MPVKIPILEVQVRKSAMTDSASVASASLPSGIIPAVIKPSDQFSTVFKTIMAGYESIEKIVNKGVVFTALGSGIILLVSAVSIKVVTIFSNIISDRINKESFNSMDFGILVAGSLIFMAMGIGVRVWGGYQAEKARRFDVTFKEESMKIAAELSKIATENSVKMAEKFLERSKEDGPKKNEDPY